MKGQAEMIYGLSALAQIQNTSLAQLRIHKNMCAVWGYDKLNAIFGTHFGRISNLLDITLSRLLQMEHAVDLQNLGRLNIGQTVEEILGSDRNMANDARAIALRVVQMPRTDLGAVSLAEDVAQFEEQRLYFFDQNLELIRQMGIQNFLATRC